MLIAALDPGKISDSFGMVVIRVDEDLITVRTARRWLGRDYTDVERTIAKYHLKHNFDHIVVEENSVGIHVVESLIRQYKLPIVAVHTSRDLKDNKKIISAKVMDKNMMALFISKLMKDNKIKFPSGKKSKDLLELERQVAIFAEFRSDSPIRRSVGYGAPGKEHDDLAMALMLAIHIGRYYLRKDDDTAIKVATKNIGDSAYDDGLGTGIPSGAVSKGRYVMMP